MTNRQHDFVHLSHNERQEVEKVFTGPVHGISPAAEAFIRKYHITFIVNFRDPVTPGEDAAFEAAEVGSSPTTGAKS